MVGAAAVVVVLVEVVAEAVAAAGVTAVEVASAAAVVVVLDSDSVTRAVISDAAPAERKPSDRRRRRLVRGWPRPKLWCMGWCGEEVVLVALVVAILAPVLLPMWATLLANCWRKVERRDCSRRERATPSEDRWDVAGSAGWWGWECGPARDRADNRRLTFR